jgi:predicted ATPase
MKTTVPFIVITGGPCAGKTSILKYLVIKLMELGFAPFICPESATLLNSMMNVGFDYKFFQKEIIETHLFFYNQLERIARNSKKPIILCDRGAIDSLAYTSRESLSKFLIDYGQIEDVRDSLYSGVIHLQTAAIDAEEFYTVLNNDARTEDPNKARLIDNHLIEIWHEHPQHYLIVNKGISFEEKKEQTLHKVLEILAIP